MTFFQRLKIAIRKFAVELCRQNSEERKKATADLTRTMLRMVLENSKIEYHYETEQDIFFCKVRVNKELFFLLVLQPKAGFIQGQSFSGADETEPLKLTEMLLFCNKWNSTKFLPKAYIDPCSNSLTGETVMLTGSVAPEELIHDTLLNVWIPGHTELFSEAFAAGIVKANEVGEADA